MMVDATSNTTALRRFKHRLTHVFRDREVIIRSEGKVRYVRLSTGLQIAGVLVVTANILWGLGAAATSWTMGRIIEARNDEIIEAKLAYETLRQGLVDYQTAIDGAVASLGGEIPEDQAFVLAGAPEGAPQELTEIARLNASLLQSIEGVQNNLDMPLEERERAIATRRALHERISELHESLEASLDKEAKLKLEAEELTARIDAILADRQRVIGERASLEEQAEDLSRQLENENATVASLTDNLAQLKQEIADSRRTSADVASQNEDLKLTIAVLRGTLTTERTERSSIESRIGDIADALASRLPGNAAMRRIENSGSVLASLEDITDDVTSDLDEARENTAAMVSVVDDVLAGLVEVSGGVNDPSSDVENKVAMARSLLGEIKGLHETQQQAVNMLISRTDESISEAERLLHMTKIDVGMISQLAGLPIEARGGPMHFEDVYTGSSSELQASVAHLEEKVERWMALRDVMACIPWVSPVDHYNVTSKYGKRRDPISGKMAMHKGIDLAGWPKTPIYAPAAGEVTYAGWHGRYGKMVEIDHGCGLVTRFGHMKTISVKAGEVLEHRTKIGTIGSTGRSTGPHVHYEIRVGGEPVDPAPFIEAGRHVFKG